VGFGASGSGDSSPTARPHHSQVCGDGALEERARDATALMNEAAREKEALLLRAMKAEADRRTVELTALARLEEMTRRTEEELGRLTKSVRSLPSVSSPAFTPRTWPLADPL
jgi:hypothetical protein